jgi:hypothetical protein
MLRIHSPLLMLLIGPLRTTIMPTWAPQMSKMSMIHTMLAIGDSKLLLLPKLLKDMVREVIISRYCVVTICLPLVEQAANEPVNDSAPTGEQAGTTSPDSEESATETKSKKQSRAPREQTAKNFRFYQGPWKHVLENAKWSIRDFIVTRNAFPGTHSDLEILCGECLSGAKAVYERDYEDLSDGNIH